MSEPYATIETARLERIEAKLDRLIGGPPPEIINIKHIMHLTGCHSITSVYRILKIIGVRPYVKGKYRRAEVENAIARKTLNDRLAYQKNNP